MQTLRNIAGKKSIITKSYAGNEGKIVTCLRLATREEKIAESDNPDDVYWVTDSLLNTIWVEPDGTETPDCTNLYWDDWMTPLQDLNEPEQQVQELYAPSPSKVLDEVK